MYYGFLSPPLAGQTFLTLIEMAGYVDLDELVVQNYVTEIEKGVNAQINLELSAMYTYLSMVRKLMQ